MAVIDIRIRALAQLFDSLDPSPFHERGLDSAADAYIVECAGETAPREALTLVLHAPTSLHARLNEAVGAIHAHYEYAASQALRRHRRRMRSGRLTLLAGIAVMVACLALRAMLEQWSSASWTQAVEEGLLVLGWVALWRPVEMLLFERWESLANIALLQRLAVVPVSIKPLPDDAD
jgi:hypothetical protein